MTRINRTNYLVALIIGNVFKFSFADDIRKSKDLNPENSKNNVSEVLKQYDLVSDRQKARLQQLKDDKRLHMNTNDAATFAQNETQKLNIGVFSMGLLNLAPWQVKCAVNVLFGGINSSHHYGCYCGRGNVMENGDPTDAIDSVCQHHDQCYLNCDQIPNCILKTGATYKWVKDAKDKIQCIDHLNNECEKRYCECDRALILEMVNATNSLGACPKDPGCEKFDAWKTQT